MDPTACLVRLLNAIVKETRDRDDAIEAAFDLANWLDGDGLFPRCKISERKDFSTCYEVG